MRRIAPLLLCCALVPAVLEAQRLQGEIVRADSSPAARVLVEWRTPSTAAQRVATDDAGRFAVVLPRADTVRLRILRPGFRPQEIAGIALAAGSTEVARFVLRDEAVTLTAVRVEETRACGARGESIAWTLWEQARTALESVVLSERDTSVHVAAVAYDATVDFDGSLLVRDSTIRVVGLDRPASRAYVDSTFRDGFVRRDADTTTYHAPTIRIVTDDRFAERYCFERVWDDVAHPDWVGVKFEPAARPGPGIADITGVLWLDRERLLLRQIDFAFINVPYRHRIDGLGGTLRFESLRTGHWLLASSLVRLPRMNTASRERSAMGLWAQGRQVYRVERQGRVLYESPAADSIRRRGR